MADRVPDQMAERLAWLWTWVSGSNEYRRRDLMADRVLPPVHTNYNTGEPCNCGWWVIAGHYLLEALRKVAAGEDPEMVYTELYANSDIERHEP